MKYIYNLINYRELIYNFTLREIKTRYKQSVLGFVWAILKPAGTVLILTVVFSHFAKFPSDGLPYPLFAYGALLPWTLFTSSIGAGVPSLINNRNLVTKIYFPREVLVLSSIISTFLDIFISAILFIVMLIFYKIGLGVTALYIIPIFIIEIIFAFGLALLLSAVNVWFRDVGQASGLLMQFWMYLTPVIYPLSMVPDRFRAFYVLNPMVGIVEGFRTCLLKGTAPDMGLLGISAVMAVIMFFTGYYIFKAKEYDFADVI